MSNPRPCQSCANWQAADRQSDYMADCAVAQRRVAFDETCAAWTAQAGASQPATQIIHARPEPWPPEWWADVVAQ